MSTAKRPEAQPWFVLRHVCIPCWQGEHDACRHRPDGPRFGRAPEGERCRCEAEGHGGGVGTCSDTRMTDYTYHRCGKPAKGTATIRARFGEHHGEPTEVERCGVHLAGLRRQAENDARWEAERVAAREQRSIEQANRQAAADWAARLRAEFGIEAHPAADADAPWVRLDPERLYGLIAEAVTEMDAFEIPHRFHPRPEPGSPGL